MRTPALFLLMMTFATSAQRCATNPRPPKVCSSGDDCHVRTHATIDTHWEPDFSLVAHGDDDAGFVILARKRTVVGSAGWRITPTGRTEKLERAALEKLPRDGASNFDQKILSHIPPLLSAYLPNCERLRTSPGKCVDQAGVVRTSTRTLRSGGRTLATWIERERRICGRRFKDIDPLASCRNSPPDP